MQSRLVGVALAATVAVLGARALAPQPAGTATPRPLEDVATAHDRPGHLSSLPLAFERAPAPRQGQTPFLARGAGYGVSLTPAALVLNLHARHAGNPSATRAARLRVGLVGASPTASSYVDDPQQGTSNYFRGRDPASWRTGVRRYGRVGYHAVYPGIDVAYYGNRGRIEYDFIVKPQADPARIRLQYEGMDALRLTPAGDLVLATPAGALVQHRPVAYQDVDGRRVAVDARFAINADRTIDFRLGDYDRRQSLVIDPVLVYSTYLGGGTADEYTSMTVDSAGNTYVTGMTDVVAQEPGNFPTVNALQPASNGDIELFVAKFDPSGKRLLFSTYFGGSGPEYTGAIRVDGAGSVYLTGCTSSADFPTRSPLQAQLKGDRDAFATKLNAAGNALVYSTYLGSSSCGTALQVDRYGRAYIAGFTWGTMPIPAKAYQPVSHQGPNEGDAFVLRLAASGATVDLGTYLGGVADDAAYGLALGSSGEIYLTGRTDSTDFPTANAFQATLQSLPFDGVEHGDAFVTKLDANATAVTYSTYLGGDDAFARGLAVGSKGNAYVTGYATGGFPLKNPMQQFTGVRDAFVAKLAADGASLVYSTYLGGSNDDIATGIAIDAGGNAYVDGWTRSVDFPTASPWQGRFGGNTDAFVSKINSYGSDLVWSSFLGGVLRDYAGSLGLDGSGAVHVAGDTDGRFPLVDPMQPAFGGGADAFVVMVKGATPTSAHYLHQDVNDDGRGDIVWHNASTGAGVVWSGADHAVRRSIATTAAHWQLAATGDFNGDHRADLLLRNDQTGANVIWDSAMAGHHQPVATLASQDWSVAGTGDFNGDGISDLLWRNRANGTNSIWLSANSGKQMPAGNATLAWTLAGTGDFNGDGKADVLWRNTSTGANTIWWSGNAWTKQSITAVTDVNWRVVGVGDFNADGHADVLWRNPATGANTIWRSASSTSLLAVKGVGGGNTWQVAAVTDYTGDRKADILWRNMTTGENILWRTGATSLRLTTVSDPAWHIGT